MPDPEDSQDEEVNVSNEAEVEIDSTHARPHFNDTKEPNQH